MGFSATSPPALVIASLSSELAEDQAPDALLITCSDSRLLPDVLVTVDPGELFVMRNVGNLVPPATVEGASTGDLSEASAIEYSVLALNVRHLIVCGHSQCGAMKAALARKPMPETPNLISPSGPRI
jgi:carbonic anhydrase